MNSNVLASDRVTLAAVIDPDATAAGAVSSGWVSMVDFDNIMAVAMAGTLGTSATLDAKLEQATNSSGAGVKDITGKAITQLVKATDDDKQAIINCRAEELDVENSFTHVRLTITVGTATSDAGGFIVGMNGRYQPVADAATVAEVVA